MSKKKTNEQADPMLFAEPGSPASMEDDRESSAPDPEAEAAAAEALLDQPPAPPIVVEPPADPLDEMMAAATADVVRDKMDSLLRLMDEVLPEQVAIARQNGHPGVSSDFNTLMLAGRQIARRIAALNYTVTK